jgi:hypothetical protein
VAAITPAAVFKNALRCMVASDESL